MENELQEEPRAPIMIVDARLLSQPPSTYLIYPFYLNIRLPRQHNTQRNYHTSMYTNSYEQRQAEYTEYLAGIVVCSRRG